MVTDIYVTGMIYNDLKLFGVIWSDLKPGLSKINNYVINCWSVSN